MKRRRIILKQATTRPAQPFYGLKCWPGDKGLSGDPVEKKSVAARLEVKATAEDGTVSIRAYGLAFGNIDSYGDIIMPGACDDFLKSEDAARMALCWQHDFTEVIGLITEKGVDDYGMWIEAQLLPTAKGKDASVLLKAGAVSEFSIGYRADRYHYEKRDGYEYDVRILDAITVYEVSPVTRAANPSARVVKVKRDDNQPNQVQPQNPKSTMTPEEIKAMRESIEKAVSEKYAADIKAAQDAVNAMKTTVEEQKTSIDNLDQTINDQQQTIQGLEDKLKAKAAATFFGALRLAMEGKRDDIKNMLAKHEGSIKLEFKVDTQTSDVSNIAYNVAVDTSIAAARLAANPFYELFAKDTVNATKFNWLEGSYTDNTGYIAELTANENDSKAAVTEYSRKFGKIGAHLLVSSEVTDFFEEVYNWARNTAQVKIINFADSEILAGAGDNSTYPNKVYGLKGVATAFSATGAKYADATVADVILDAQMQALAKGYNLDIAFVTYALYAQIRGLKDANGHYLYNEVTGMLNGVRIVPSAKLTSASLDLLLADSSVVRIKERPVWELEIVRNASKDGWDVYLRKAVQVLVKGPDVYGVIKVASAATSIAAITVASSAAAIAGTIDAETGAIKINDVTPTT